ncbi:uncharacterized protein TNCV_4963551 [Trichonephila clavipes]|nr:uncharacterized protein TNCV_4963551 [Trichonephila clavipes]
METPALSPTVIRHKEGSFSMHGLDAVLNEQDLGDLWSSNIFITGSQSETKLTSPYFKNLDKYQSPMMFISRGFHPMLTSFETNKQISWIKRVVMLLHLSLLPSPTLNINLGLNLNFKGVQDPAQSSLGPLKASYDSGITRSINNSPHLVSNEANPQVYVETPLHPEKLTVWCALWAGGFIGPYFFKNDEGHNVTVNGDRYRAMVTNFFIPKLNNHDVQELWFQQDGATCHRARATIDLLKDTFGNRLISRFGPVNWPPRSCDLTPLDYFLWGYVKSLDYADKPQTLDHLEENIRRVIADIRPQMLE